MFLITTGLVIIIAVTLLSVFVHYLSKPPKHLRTSFNAVPFYAIYVHLIQKSTNFDFWRNYLFPLLQQDKVVLFHSLFFWILQIGDYETAKLSLSSQGMFLPALSHQTILELFPKLILFDASTKFKNTLASRFFGKNIASSEGEEWKRFHRIGSKAFSRIWPTEVIGGIAQRFVEVLEKEKTVDISSWLKRLTFDVLSESVLDLKINAMENDKAPLYWHVRKIMKGILQSAWLLLYPFDRAWNPFRKEYFDALEEYETILNATIDQRKQELELSKESLESTKKKDLLSLLIAANAEEECKNQLSMEEIRHNLTIFFIAGHDTTATALTTALYMLAIHPDIQDRARQEVVREMNQYDLEAIPTHQNLRNMPLILCIIKESQRLYPSVTQIGHRKATADVTLPDGRIIPKDTIVSVNVWQINRDPDVWENPDTFNPDRFMDDPTSTAQPKNYLTFSYGKRICLGMQFSILEQRVILSMLLRRFKWSLANPNETLGFEPPGLLVPKALNIKFELVE